MKCSECKFLDPRGFAGEVVKWICVADRSYSISYDDFPSNIECTLPDGPPPQLLPEPENEHLKPLFNLAVETYKKIYAAYVVSNDRDEQDEELVSAENKLCDLLLEGFNLSWPDIKQLRNEAYFSVKLKQ